MRVNEASEVKFLKGKDTELKDVTDVDISHMFVEKLVI